MPKFSNIVRSWKINGDGAGIMFSHKDENKVKFIKGLMTFEVFMKAYEEAPFWANPEDYAIAIHLRMATHWGRTQGYCHPFPTYFLEDSEMLRLYGEADEMVMHNGVLQQAVSKESEEQKAKGFSDTMSFVENVLYWLSQEDKLKLWPEIGYNKLVFMRWGGKMDIVNPQMGEKTPEGIWFSNRISYYNY